MKTIHFFLILLLSVTTIIAQNINKMDANGKRHGKWKKNFKGTEVPRYEGEFSHGKEIGTFKYYVEHESKSLLKATKVFNSKNAIAEVTFYNQKGKVVSKGKMNGKKYIGQWLYYHLNSTQVMTDEKYNNKGELHGKRIVYYPKGVLAEESTYVRGKKQGLVKNYSDKKQLLKESTYKDDMLHGPLKAYTGSGKLYIEGQYKNDKKHGIWTFYKDGKVERKDFTKKSKNPYKNKAKKQ